MYKFLKLSKYLLLISCFYLLSHEEINAQTGVLTTRDKQCLVARAVNKELAEICNMYHDLKSYVEYTSYASDFIKDVKDRLSIIKVVQRFSLLCI